MQAEPGRRGLAATTRSFADGVPRWGIFFCARISHSAFAAGTNEAQAIIRKMKEKPIDDDLFGPVVVRADGRAIHNMHIFKVKSPEVSKSKWDLLEKVGVLTGPEAFRPLEEGGCSLAENSKQYVADPITTRLAI